MDNQPNIHPDWQIIESLGGPTVVAKLLGYELPFGVQRVSNWKRRGIPDAVRLRNMSIFGAPSCEPKEARDAA